MKVILHFGTYKTGSSSIQISLHKNLSDPAFRYAGLGDKNHSVPLMTMFMQDPASHHSHQTGGSSERTIAKLRSTLLATLDREIEEWNGRTLVLSGEDVSSLRVPELVGLRRYLESRGCEVTAVAYVRAPKGSMESLFQQKVKGGKHDFPVSRLFPPYAQVLAFDGVFGRENVLLWRFDPSTFPGKDVVLDFCGRLGIDFTAEQSIKVNESLSLPAVKLLHCYRKFGPGYGWGRQAGRQNNLLIDRLRTLNGAKLRLHSELVTPVLEDNAARIAAMEERLGASLEEDLQKYDDVALRSDAELLVVDDETTYWLAQQLGPEYEQRWQARMPAQEIAEWMHALRLQLSPDSAFVPESPRQAQQHALGLAGMEALATRVKRLDPSLEIVPDAQVITILHEAFKVIRGEVFNASDNPVHIASLGSFSVPAARRTDASREMPLTFVPARPRSALE